MDLLPNHDNKILNGQKSQLDIKLKLDKAPNGQNPELDKISNGRNFKLHKIPKYAPKLLKIKYRTFRRCRKLKEIWFNFFINFLEILLLNY